MPPPPEHNGSHLRHDTGRDENISGEPNGIPTAKAVIIAPCSEVFELNGNREGKGVVTKLIHATRHGMLQGLEIAGIVVAESDADILRQYGYLQGEDLPILPDIQPIDVRHIPDLSRNIHEQPSNAFEGLPSNVRVNLRSHFDAFVYIAPPSNTSPEKILWHRGTERAKFESSVRRYMEDVEINTEEMRARKENCRANLLIVLDPDCTIMNLRLSINGHFGSTLSLQQIIPAHSNNGNADRITALVIETPDREHMPVLEQIPFQESPTTEEITGLVVNGIRNYLLRYWPIVQKQK